MQILDLLEELEKELNGTKRLFNAKADLGRCREIVASLKEYLPAQ